MNGAADEYIGRVDERRRDLLFFESGSLSTGECRHDEVEGVPRVGVDGQGIQKLTR